MRLTGFVLMAWFASLAWQALAATPREAGVSMASGQVHSYRADLVYGNDETRRTRINNFELTLSQPLLPRWEGRLSLGYVDITQSSNPLTAGQSTAGPFIAVGVLGRILEAGPLALSLDTGYRYVQTTGRQGDQEIELRWHQVDAVARLDWRLGQVPSLFIGAGAHYVDGEEIARGPVSQVLEVDNETRYSARLGVDFQVDPGGHIGVEMHTGFADGARIYFLRRF